MELRKTIAIVIPSVVICVLLGLLALPSIVELNFDSQTKKSLHDQSIHSSYAMNYYY